ncbi:MAG: hypothetical protein P0111_00890 [Nitrospira sp.]|nr:hypothetical protein [Nitrospira sp.]
MTQCVQSPGAIRILPGLPGTGAWLIWLFLLSAFQPSFAQESSSSSEQRERTSFEEQGHAAGSQGTDQALPLDEATSGPEDERASRPRPVVRRFGAKPLTPEQQEEARRLSAIAARMGTDPTAIVGRVETFFRYDALAGGGRNSNVVGRIDVPYHKNIVLRADLPYVWSNPNQPGTSNRRGLSDLLVRAGGRVYSDPADTIFLGMDFTFPTAEDTLGTGKYTVGPGLATAHVFPAWGSLIFALLQHQFSVGGDPSRNDISASRLQCWFNTIWSDHWWTQLEAVGQMDWERKEKTSMVLEFEGGYRFKKDWGLWLRPGVGLWGRDLPGAYDWMIEVGIRRMFVGF